jgi:hypothetical protein
MVIPITMPSLKYRVLHREEKPDNFTSDSIFESVTKRGFHPHSLFPSNPTPSPPIHRVSNLEFHNGECIDLESSLRYQIVVVDEFIDRIWCDASDSTIDIRHSHTLHSPSFRPQSLPISHHTAVLWMFRCFQHFQSDSWVLEYSLSSGSSRILLRRSSTQHLDLLFFSSLTSLSHSYELTSTKKKEFTKEVTMAFWASVLTGFGALFMLLWTGVYV